MSIDRIEPIRPGPPKIYRIDRDRDRERDRGKQQPPPRERRDDDAKDDGLPHIDVTA